VPGSRCGSTWPGWNLRNWRRSWISATSPTPSRGGRPSKSWRARRGRAEREERPLTEGYPAYTTTPGWLGYSDDKLDRLAREAVEQGFTMIKLKVGADVADDVRRMKVARAAVGDSVRIAVDANQCWDVGPAIEWMRALAPYDPYWIEEPTRPDDVLGHATIRRAIHSIKVATAEHVANRVVFKQLLQAGAVDIVQIDAARVAGVNENLAVLLLAAKHGIPVCPHASGVGLCEMVQHLSMLDYVAVSGIWEDRVIEHVDHLHEHFVTPVRLERGRYRAPLAAGEGGEMLAASVAQYKLPGRPSLGGPPAVNGSSSPARGVAATSVQVEDLFGGRPPLALGGRLQGLLHRIGQLPPPLCLRVGGDLGLRGSPVVPGVFQVAEQQAVAQKDRVVLHTDTPQGGQHARPDVGVQPPVLDFVLWTQADDGGGATGTAISSLGAVGAGVCCAHRSILASRP
jgi:hypothetical protein